MHYQILYSGQQPPTTVTCPWSSILKVQEIIPPTRGQGSILVPKAPSQPNRHLVPADPVNVPSEKNQSVIEINLV